MTRPATVWTAGPARPTTVPYETPGRPASVWTPGSDLPSQRELGLTDTEYAGLVADLSACAVLETDALMRGVLVWMDHLSAGKAQSIGDSRSAPSGEFNLPSSSLGRYFDRSSDAHFTFSNTGGLVGGGYIEAILADAFLGVAGYYGSGEDFLSGTDDEFPLQNSSITIHDLRGQVFDTPQILQSFGGHSRIEVLPDLRLRAMDNSSFDSPVVLATSTATVPPTGPFAIETQVGPQPVGYRYGGFVLLNIYTYADDAPIRGVAGLRFLSNPARTISTSAGQYNRFHVPLGTRLLGAGVIHPYGSVACWQYALIFAAAMPVSDLETESVIGHAHSEVFGSTFPDGDPVTIATDFTWGNVQRWRNVLSKVHSAYEGEEQLTTNIALGELSSFTGRWLSGPVLPSAETIVRNTLLDGAKDFYGVALDVTIPPVEIVGVGPFALVGVRFNQGLYTGSVGIFNAPLPWMFTGPNPKAPERYDDPFYGVNGAGREHHLYRLQVKTSEGATVEGRMGIGLPGRHGTSDTSAWRTLKRFQTNPPTVMRAQPSGDPWLPDDLPSPGVVTDFSRLDALVGLDPAERWMHLDVAQAGLDVAYRARRVPETIVPQRAPIADLILVVSSAFTDPTIGKISVYDGSVDFNGTQNEVVSGVVSRILDWGDGSATVALAGGGFANRAVHTYAASGSYTLTLTVTNALGLTATATLVFEALGEITAALGAVADEDDEDGLTIDFTELSSITLGAVVARAWTFGDGGTSALANPTHTYSAPGTYTVTLTVTGDAGQIATSTSDLTVPAPGGVGDPACEEFTGTPPLGVQGDDMKGGNPPFPAWLSKELFLAWYWGDVFREYYDTGFAREDEIDLDADEPYNGAPSMVGYYGSRSPDPGIFAGAGFFSTPTDDGDPDETYYTTGPHEYWARSRVKGEVGVMSDASLLSSNDGEGLEVLAISPRDAYTQTSLRAGKLYLDVYTRLGGVSTTHTYEVCDEDVFLGRAPGTWAEVGMFYQWDEPGQKLRVRVWAGDACDMEGAEALVDTGWLSDDRTRNYVDYIERGNWFFNPTGPKKKWWHGTGSNRDAAVEPNPFGYALAA